MVKKIKNSTFYAGKIKIIQFRTGSLVAAIFTSNFSALRQKKKKKKAIRVFLSCPKQGKTITVLHTQE